MGRRRKEGRKDGRTVCMHARKIFGPQGYFSPIKKMGEENEFQYKVKACSVCAVR
jgi:hypothetical protein